MGKILLAWLLYVGTAVAATEELTQLEGQLDHLYYTSLRPARGGPAVITPQAARKRFTLIRRQLEAASHRPRSVLNQYFRVGEKLAQVLVANGIPSIPSLYQIRVLPEEATFQTTRLEQRGQFPTVALVYENHLLGLSHARLLGLELGVRAAIPTQAGLLQHTRYLARRALRTTASEIHVLLGSKNQDVPPLFANLVGVTASSLQEEDFRRTREIHFRQSLEVTAPRSSRPIRIAEAIAKTICQSRCLSLQALTLYSLEQYLEVEIARVLKGAMELTPRTLGQLIEAELLAQLTAIYEQTVRATIMEFFVRLSQLQRSLKILSLHHKGEGFLEEDELKRLQELAARVKQDPVRSDWLDRLHKKEIVLDAQFIERALRRVKLTVDVKTWRRRAQHFNQNRQKAFFNHLKREATRVPRQPEPMLLVSAVLGALRADTPARPNLDTLAKQRTYSDMRREFFSLVNLELGMGLVKDGQLNLTQALRRVEDHRVELKRNVHSREPTHVRQEKKLTEVWQERWLDLLQVARVLKFDRWVSPTAGASAILSARLHKDYMTAFQYRLLTRYPILALEIDGRTLLERFRRGQEFSLAGALRTLLENISAQHRRLQTAQSLEDLEILLSTSRFMASLRSAAPEYHREIRTHQKRMLDRSVIETIVFDQVNPPLAAAYTSVFALQAGQLFFWLHRKLRHIPGVRRLVFKGAFFRRTLLVPSLVYSKLEPVFAGFLRATLLPFAAGLALEGYRTFAGDPSQELNELFFSGVSPSRFLPYYEWLTQIGEFQSRKLQFLIFPVAVVVGIPAVILTGRAIRAIASGRLLTFQKINTPGGPVPLRRACQQLEDFRLLGIRPGHWQEVTRSQLRLRQGEASLSGAPGKQLRRLRVELRAAYLRLQRARKQLHTWSGEDLQRLIGEALQ